MARSQSIPIVIRHLKALLSRLTQEDFSTLTEDLALARAIEILKDIEVNHG